MRIEIAQSSLRGILHHEVGDTALCSILVGLWLYANVSNLHNMGIEVLQIGDGTRFSQELLSQIVLQVRPRQHFDRLSLIGEIEMFCQIDFGIATPTNKVCQ